MIMQNSREIAFSEYVFTNVMNNGIRTHIIFNIIPPNWEGAGTVNVVRLRAERNGNMDITTFVYIIH